MGTKQGDVKSTRYRQDASSNEIESDIKTTRSNMDETLNELGDRLHPRNLLDDLIDVFRSDGPHGDALGERVSESAQRSFKSIARTIRENPIPAVMVGAAAAWMIFDASTDEDDEAIDPDSYFARHSGMVAHGHETEKYSGEVGDREIRSGSTSNDGAKSGKPTIGQRVKGAGTAVAESLSSAGSAVAEPLSDAASSAAEAVKDTARDTWSGTRRGGKRLSREAGRLTKRAGASARYSGEVLASAYDSTRERFSRASDEYPIAVGAGCLALGLLVGLAIPRTRREDEFLGDMSDEFIDQAYETGEELVDRGKQIAAATAHSALDEAESAGLGTNPLGDKVRRVATAAKDAAADAAKDEGLHPEQLKETATNVAAESVATAKEESKEQAEEFKQ